MQLRLIDSHAHLHFPAFDNDREEVVGRCRESKTGVITVGTKFATSKSALELAQKYPELAWATVGFHPLHIEQSYHDKNEEAELEKEKFDYGKMLELSRSLKAVGIGECGLDYAVFVRKRSERQQKRAPAKAFGEGGLSPTEDEKRIKNKQKEVFIKQIELAHEVKKPLVIHCRDAFEDLIEILNSKSYILNSPPGVIHFFSGTLEDAQKLLQLGFYLGFAGPITFSHDYYDEVIRNTPLDRILVETDAPYASPVPYRGKRNEPAYVIEVAKKIAEIKGMDFVAVAAAATENTKRLFRL